MRRFRAVHVLVLLFCLHAGIRADTLYLKEGEQYLGRLKEMTADTVVFGTREGERTLPKCDILRIQLQRARMFDEVETADQITDPDLKACIANQPSEADFPADGSLTLLERLTYDLTEPGVVKETHRTISKVLEQRGEDVATNSVWYFEDTDTPEIDFALTVAPDGRVLHLSDAALKNESTYARLPDYRRLARFRFACKEPRPGNILDVQYTVTRKRGTLLDPFYAGILFRGNEPILRKEVIVIVPADKEDQVVAQLTGPEVIGAAREESGGLVRLVWTLTEPQPGIRDEPLMPPKKQFVPALTLGQAGTWDEVAAAYAEALDAIPPLPEDLAVKAVELADEGGAQAIHDFLARDIRTASVPHWHFRITPYPPEETAKRGLANELDKNVLYMEMLEAAAIECELALVCGRSRGPLSEGVPSLRAFDRSAVYLTKKGVFSNASSDRLAFGTLPGELQGAPALVVTADGGALTRTSLSRPEEELDATRFEAALEADGRLDIVVTYSGQGNSGSWMRGWKDLNEQDLRNIVQQVASGLHPAAVLEDYETTDLADLTVNPALTMHCAIPDYAVKAGDELMLFNLPAVSYDAGQVGRPTREHDLKWGHVGREATEGVIRLPKGFKVHSMPQNAAFDSPTVSYKAKLKKRWGKLKFNDTYDLKVHEAPRDAYGDYKKCLELRAEIPRQRIILTRKGKRARQEVGVKRREL